MARWPWAIALALGLTWLLLKYLRPKQVIVEATIWRPSAPGFEWPEVEEGSPLRNYLLARDSFGVALAGGGERGSSLAHGAIRALRKAGILKHARYLTTTSGSVWTGLPLYYQSVTSLDEYLGESYNPAELTPQLLTGASVGLGVAGLVGFGAWPPKFQPNSSSLNDAFDGGDDAKLRKSLRNREAEPQEVQEAQAILEGFRSCLKDRGLCSCLSDLAIPDGSLQEIYEIATGHFFLKPFDLNERGSFQCHESEVDELQEQLPTGRKIYAAKDQSQDLPFHILQTALLAPYSGRLEDPNSTIASFQIEHTAIYTGIPSGYTGEAANPYHGVGDVLVSSFAWNGAALESVGPGAKSTVKVAKIPTLANTGELAEVNGVATAYIADFQARDWGRKIPKCLVTLMEKVLPHTHVWSPLDVGRDGIPVTKYLATGDAGIADDVGHLPLLRRGVRKMVIYTSAAVHDTSSGKEATNPCEMVYEIAAFGQRGCLDPSTPAGAPAMGLPEGSMTVFEPSEFQPFWSDVMDKFKRREPCVHRGTFTVVDNNFLGIKGGWQVEIVWVILMPSQTWLNALPADTASVLRPYFPNYSAGEPKYRMVFSAMSQYASWVTDSQVVKEVKAMLNITDLDEDEAEHHEHLGERVAELVV